MTLREAMKLHGVVGLFGAVVLGARGRLVIRTCRSVEAGTECVIRCVTDKGEQWLNIDTTEVLSSIAVERA